MLINATSLFGEVFSQYDILLQYSVLTVNDQLLCVVGVGWGWDTFSAVGLGGEKVAETVLV